MIRRSLALLVLLHCGQALAGGFSYPDLGTAPLGRGGAFVARADDPTAIWYNVAGAARLEGTQILLDTNLFYERSRFQRQIYPQAGGSVELQGYPHQRDQQMPEIGNDDAPFPIPVFSVTSDLAGLLRPLNLVLIAGIYGPNAHPSRTYPRTCAPGVSFCQPGADSGLPSPARYDTVSTSILVLTPSLGLAWRPIPSLSIGAAFQAAYARFIIDKVVVATITRDGQGEPSEDPGEDIDVRLDAADRFTPSGTFGIHWRPFGWLELGGAFQLAVKHNTSGEVKIDIPGSITQRLGVTSEPNPADLRIALTIPAQARFGMRYINRDAQQRERFDLELDGTWESTSDLQIFAVENNAGLKFGALPQAVPVGTLEQHYQWRDTFGLRFGGAYRLYDLFTRGLCLILRGGFFYESSAAPDSHLRLDFLPLERLALTLGLGIDWGRWRLGLGYAHIFHPERTVAPENGQGGSEAEVLVPLAPGTGPAMGNGIYNLDIDLFSLGLMLRL